MTLNAFNSVFAFVIFLVGACSVARMDASTVNSVRVAIIMVMIGGLGQAMGFASDGWAPWLDTILYGGILTLLLANRRSPQLVTVVWASRFAYVVVGVVIAALLAYSVFT